MLLHKVDALFEEFGIAVIFQRIGDAGTLLQHSGAKFQNKAGKLNSGKRDLRQTTNLLIGPFHPLPPQLHRQHPLQREPEQRGKRPMLADGKSGVNAVQCRNRLQNVPAVTASRRQQNERSRTAQARFRPLLAILHLPFQHQSEIKTADSMKRALDNGGIPAEKCRKKRRYQSSAQCPGYGETVHLVVTDFSHIPYHILRGSDLQAAGKKNCRIVLSIYSFA